MDFETAVAGLKARGPGRMVPDLTRITRLAELLGDPQQSVPSVHVTGTNGKTSTTRMIAALLGASGLHAGTYTSPHLQSVRERFTVAGSMIGEQRLADLYADVTPLADLVDTEQAVAGSDDRVTYFEMLTAMAYWFFADEPVDVAVVEVGMGGRWDATNLLRGDVAVLTPIAVDHVQLGRTPAETAIEKAGIIKPGSVVVVADQDPDVMIVIEQAAEDVGAGPVLIAGEDHELVDLELGVGGQQLTIRVGERVIRDIFLPLFGAHQADNAVTALAAVAALLGDTFSDLTDELIRRGFLTVTSPGRLEVVNREPTVILDGAHNPHGAVTAAAALTTAFDFGQVILVMGCMDDKDAKGILTPFAEIANHVIVTTAQGPRASASVEKLAAIGAEIWGGTGVAVEGAIDIAEALDLAHGLARPGDGILVTGSLYAVGEARDRYLPILDAGDDIAIDEPSEQSEAEEEAEFQSALDDMIARVDHEREN